MKSIVNKPWGSYEIIDQGKNYLAKKITINPKGSLSFQSHDHRSEHWVVVEGQAEVTLENKITNLRENQSIFIPKKTKHMVSNTQNDVLIIVEVWYGEKLSEDDIIRYKDIYGRV